MFGAGTPAAKMLLGPVNPWLLAGLLYLGSGLGLALLRLLRRAEPARVAPGESKWLAGAVVAGGMVAPVLLMWGLARMRASGAALLLNAEGVLTALLAWFVFRENFDRRIAIGMALIVVGALILSWPEDTSFWSALRSGFTSSGHGAHGYFSTAPFAGALLAIPLLGESLSTRLIVAAPFMGWGCMAAPDRTARARTYT